MRQQIVAGNWKMNLMRSEAKSLFDSIANLKSDALCEVYQFVPSLFIADLVDQSRSSPLIGAQNAHPKSNGAFTGEISMRQIKDLGVKAILVGHSERRQLFEESNDFLKEKVDSAISEGLTLFFCCGESLDQRENGSHEQVVISQLKASIFHISQNDFKNVIIAYEPVWAIGTGKTATSDQANEMHSAIRSAIAGNYSKDIANNTSILYGGSCKPSNAEDLFSKEHIDGGLIGGASLNVDEFAGIINAFR
jgi:triosephosphate isomerase